MKKTRNLKFLVLLIIIGVFITTPVLVSYAYMPSNQSFSTTKEGEIGKVYWKFDTDTLYLNNTQVDATYSLIDENDINTSTDIDDKRPWENVKEKIVNVNIENNIKPTTTYRWFEYFSKLHNIINVDNLDMSNVLKKDHMFRKCSNLKISDIVNYGILGNERIKIVNRSFQKEVLLGAKIKFTEVLDSDKNGYTKTPNGHSFVISLDSDENVIDLYLGREYAIEQILPPYGYKKNNDIAYIIAYDNTDYYLFDTMYCYDVETPYIYEYNKKIEKEGFKIFESLDDAQAEAYKNIFSPGEHIFVKYYINKDSYFLFEYEWSDKILMSVSNKNAYPNNDVPGNIIYIFNEKNVNNTSEVKFINKNKTNTSISGVEVEVITSDGIRVDKWISGTDYHRLDLYDGEYIIKELKAPNGYELNKEEVNFTIKNQKISKMDSYSFINYNNNEITMISNEIKTKDENEQINEESPETGSFISYNFIILSLIGLLIFGYYLKNKRNIFVK